ncbi:MAG: STAS domain-containing protein [Actinomycetes bacterium]
MIVRTGQRASRGGRAAGAAAASYDLAVTAVRHVDELLDCVSGRLDAQTDDLLVGCCRSWADDGVRAAVLDLAGLTGMDGHGLASLVRCRRVLRAHGGRLRVVNAPADLAATMARTGM